ncbi:MAG: uroporphyrinogen-III synthase, partial [Actinobacteria bacterium]|nr:uroporphyrinogen-III synthase [Actinomycetota bacterium]
MEAALAAKGWTPVRVTAYRTRLAARMPAAAERALRDGPLDAVTFTSASTVNGFLSMAGTELAMGAGLASAKLVCIGPVTARTLRRAGLPVAAVASPHTIEGLIRTLERTLGRPGEESS